MAEAEDSEAFLTDDIRELLSLISESDIAEIKIQRGDAKVHIKRNIGQPQLVSVMPGAVHHPVAAAAPLVAGAAPQPAAVVEESQAASGFTVTAPMVGTFFASPAPKDPPYVQPGDEVRPGDVLGIIEAMKIMNEIECEIQGQVRETLVENGQPVEYGQPLMIIDPA